MRKFKGTPGPWRIGNFGSTIVSDSNANMDIVGSDTDDSVKYYGGFLIAESVGKANAQIIAAAPELLEALQGMISFIQSNGISIPADISTAPIGFAKTAIAKALGTPINETNPITQSTEREANNAG